MSTANTPVDATHDVHDSHDDHEHHDPNLAHHFDTPQQQFATAKLGMWVFLATEILMFGGLFCAYAVYRANFPEVFMYAHKVLDTTMGTINTVILLASSFTMAWGVRAAQRGENKKLMLLLMLTLIGGTAFMGIKAYEYAHKWEEGFWFGPENRFHPAYEGELDKSVAKGHKDDKGHGAKGADATGADSDDAAQGDDGAHSDDGTHADRSHKDGHAAKGKPKLVAQGDEVFDPHAGSADEAKILPTYLHRSGLTDDLAKGKHQMTYDDLSEVPQRHVISFFGVYFAMTALHAIHVLVGMGLIVWIYIRAMSHEFGPKWFTPVDLVGLYWHLVDLIWIFLFPLLYLIH